MSFSQTGVFERPHPPVGVAHKIKALRFSKTILEMLFLISSVPTSFEKKSIPMLLGYARFSTQDQNLDLQREALTKAGCQKVFEDQISGMLREGDTLVVWKLGRLGRSVKQLVDLVGELPHAKNG